MVIQPLYVRWSAFLTIDADQTPFVLKMATGLTSKAERYATEVEQLATSLRYSQGTYNSNLWRWIDFKDVTLRAFIRGGGVEYELDRTKQESITW